MLSIKEQSIFAFSDTHGNHRELKVPENVDIVICAGDAVEDNLAGNEYDDFIEWFASLPCKWKIFVPGNHELSFELDQADGIIQRMTDKGITVLKTLDELNLSADEVIVVGDTSFDIDMGRNAGTRTCGVNYGIGSTEGLSKADWLIDDFADILNIID